MKHSAALILHVTLSLALPLLQAAETIDAPADWREWPLDPSDRPDRAAPRNRIDPATVPMIPASPGAEGHGALSIGGRGGRVIHVTTLDGKGPGSLEEALQAKGPRLVVFEVSGVIRGDFVITEPNITVAGQTSPGAGITIEGTLYTKFAKWPNVGNVIGNYFKAGPSSDLIKPLCFKKDTAYHAVDNFIHGTGLIRDPWDEAHKHPGLQAFAANGERLSRPRPNPYFPITIHDAERACELVLAHAGCLPRDRVSVRTMEEVKTGTGKWGRHAPDKPTDEWFLEGIKPGTPAPDTDRDGVPDEWETSHGSNPTHPADAAKRVPRGASPEDRHAGYTFIEFYVNELADQLVLGALGDACVKPELPGSTTKNK